MQTLQSIVTAIFLLLIFPHVIQAQQKPKKVMVFEIREEIDPRMSRKVDLALSQAKDIKADIVIIDMDTYGGAVTDADKIRTAILDFPIPIWVFINKNAASAGALISIACDSIYMTPGANIGAATVVGGDGQPAPEKYQSYMKSMMRSTAITNKRDPKIAEGMVGNFSEEDTSRYANKVVTFSTEEAIENNYCEGKVTSIEEILNKNNVTNYELVKYQLSTIENIIAFFLNPYLRSILILIILGGIYFELQTPGVGFPIIASAIAAALYFVPSYIHGFAQNWEILVFILGIALLLLEFLVIPGFGIAGIAGITLTVGGLILVMIDNDFFDFTMVPSEAIAEAIAVLVVAVFGGIVFTIAITPKMLESRFFKKISLQDKMDTSEGYTSNFYSSELAGKEGVAWTVLRPSGKVMIDDIIYDAYTRGDFINKGEKIVVIEVSTTNLKVRKNDK